MSEVSQVVALSALARSNPEGVELPGTNLSVSVVSEKLEFTLESNLWVLVLEGELIIDLPFGDFRILKVGESLQLLKDLQVSWQPLDEVVLLKQG